MPLEGAEGGMLVVVRKGTYEMGLPLLLEVQMGGAEELPKGD